MLDRIIGKSKAKSDDEEDCLSCRLIGGGGMACLGVYVLYKSYTRRQSMTKWSLIGSACLGSVILSIASLRLLDIRLEDKNKTKNRN